MTELLQRAFLLASTRDEEEQNALALVLLDGLEDGLTAASFEGWDPRWEEEGVPDEREAL